jgi:autotransporter passenger strand-loop-strand repeat protein
MTDIRVSSGQTVTSTTLGAGDTMEVFAGGSAVRTEVLAGGVLTISGGTTTGTIVLGGEEVVSAGGVAHGGTVRGVGRAQGEEIVSAGGVAIGTRIGRFGEQVLLSGGAARDTAMTGGDQVVSGGAAIRTSGSGFQTVSAGGVAIGTSLAGGGLEIGPGGVARGAVIGAGAGEFVFSGGVAVGGVVGGEIDIVSGGVAVGTTVGSGGIEVVAGLFAGVPGGVARNTVIDSGGKVFVGSGGVIDTPVISGGSLRLEKRYRLGGAIDFAAGTSGGSIEIFGVRLPGSAHVISGFAPGDAIDLATIAFASGGSATLAKGNELEITKGGKTYTLFFDPKQDFSGFVFTLSGDGRHGTLVTEEKAPAAAAPAAGFAQSLAGTDIRVGSGQTSSGITLGAHDTMEVFSGGTAIDTRVLAGGLLTLSGGAADGTLVRSGGEEIVSSGGAARHTIVGSGGEATVPSGGRIVAPVISGGLLMLDPGYRLGGAIDFAGAGGELVIDAATVPGSAHVISGLAPGDVIDLVFAPFFSGGSATLAAGNELHITEGGKTYTLFLDPKQDLSGDGFTLAFGDHFGTEVIVHSARPTDIRVGSG